MFVTWLAFVSVVPGEVVFVGDSGVEDDALVDGVLEVGSEGVCVDVPDA